MKLITWSNVERKLSDLIPWDKNPRHLTDRQAEELQKSIMRFGLAQPFLISPKDDIYDGHQRQSLLDIMEEYGADADIDCRMSSRMLTADERRELVVRLHENVGEWDYEGLTELYTMDELTGWGLPAWRLPIQNANDPDEEWAGGMPEFDSKHLTFRSITINFVNQQDVDDFKELVGHEFTDKTVSMFWPYHGAEKLLALSYEDEDGS